MKAEMLGFPILRATPRPIPGSAPSGRAFSEVFSAKLEEPVVPLISDRKESPTTETGEESGTMSTRLQSRSADDPADAKDGEDGFADEWSDAVEAGSEIDVHPASFSEREVPTVPVQAQIAATPEHGLAGRESPEPTPVVEPVGVPLPRQGRNRIDPEPEVATGTPATVPAPAPALRPAVVPSGPAFGSPATILAAEPEPGPQLRRPKRSSLSPDIGAAPANRTFPSLEPMLRTPPVASRVPVADGKNIPDHAAAPPGDRSLVPATVHTDYRDRRLSEPPIPNEVDLHRKILLVPRTGPEASVYRAQSAIPGAETRTACIETLRVATATVVNVSGPMPRSAKVAPTLEMSRHQPERDSVLTAPAVEMDRTSHISTPAQRSPMNTLQVSAFSERALSGSLSASATPIGDAAVTPGRDQVRQPKVIAPDPPVPWVEQTKSAQSQTIPEETPGSAQRPAANGKIIPEIAKQGSQAAVATPSPTDIPSDKDAIRSVVPRRELSVHPKAPYSAGTKPAPSETATLRTDSVPHERANRAPRQTIIGPEKGSVVEPKIASIPPVASPAGATVPETDVQEVVPRPASATAPELPTLTGTRQIGRAHV